MKNTINKLNPFASYTKTVAGITANLGNTLDALRNHAEIMVARADALEAQIDNLARQRLDAIDERTKADRVAKNIARLLDA